MAKFIGKLIIVLFCFIFIITFLNEQKTSPDNVREELDPQILISSDDFYLEQVEEQVVWAESDPEQESVTYYIAQLIEKSGLMIYEGILTIMTDLAKVI